MKVVSTAWRSWIRGTRNPPAYSIDGYAQCAPVHRHAAGPFRRRYSTAWTGPSRQSGPAGWNRRRLVFASGSAVAGATFLAFTDDIKASYETVERTGRVAVALAVCINE